MGSLNGLVCLILSKLNEIECCDYNIIVWLFNIRYGLVVWVEILELDFRFVLEEKMKWF